MSYDPSITDGSWQDFRLTAASAEAIDTGGELPASLVALLEKFHIDPGRKGAALDRGAIEFDPDNPGAPFTIDVGPTDGSEAIVAPWAGEEPPPDVPPASGDGGCGCRTAGSAGGGTGLWLGLIACGAVVARRRRARASPG